MSTQVMAAHVSLDVRMVLPGHARPSSRPRIVPSPICVSRVRRCLFGLASEPQDAVQHAAQELKRQAQMDSQRWSFDFALEKPLAGGQYVWSAVHDTPAEQPHASGDQSPSRMRQPQITEFLQSRKRTSSGTLSAANNKRACVRSTPACDAASRT